MALTRRPEMMKKKPQRTQIFTERAIGVSL